MKRSILGFGLLLALLVLGLFTSGRMEKRHAPIQAALDAAADSVAEENWRGAGILLQEAKTRWERRWPTTPPWRKSTAFLQGYWNTAGRRTPGNLPQAAGSFPGW